MITEKSNRLQVIVITDYNYPNSGWILNKLKLNVFLASSLWTYALYTLFAAFPHNSFKEKSNEFIVNKLLINTTTTRNNIFNHTPTFHHNASLP